MDFNNKIIVCDIDGTVSNPVHRIKHIEKSPKDWDSFYNECINDDPHLDIIEMLKTLYYTNSNVYGFYFCTGRRESCRIDTEHWIRKNINFLCGESKLLMRADNDKRHDTIVKPELLKNEGITPENTLFILEDRNSMVNKWRELGYRCLQVAEGDF